MKFGELRKLIFNDCQVLKGKEVYKDFQTHLDDRFDNEEVIGIRSRGVAIGGYWCNTYIEVLLKDDNSSN